MFTDAGLRTRGVGPHKRPQDQTDAQAVPYKLTSDNDIVVFNGAITTIAKVLDEKLTKDPKAVMAYHKHTDNPNEPGRFDIEQTHNVVFHRGGKNTKTKKKGEEKGQDDPASDPEDKTDPTQNNLGGHVPPATWNSHSCAFIWHVKWTAKGLMPIKPDVRFTSEFILPTGRALDLSL